MSQNYVLFDRNTKAFVYGYQTNAIQRMLDFDYICKRPAPSISAIIFLVSAPLAILWPWLA